MSVLHLLVYVLLVSSPCPQCWKQPAQLFGTFAKCLGVFPVRTGTVSRGASILELNQLCALQYSVLSTEIGNNIVMCHSIPTGSGVFPLSKTAATFCTRRHAIMVMVESLKHQIQLRDSLPPVRTASVLHDSWGPCTTAVDESP